MAKIIKEGRQELTKAELEIMQVIWKRGKVLVHDILDEMSEPKPAYNGYWRARVSSHTRLTAGLTSIFLWCPKTNTPVPTCAQCWTTSSTAR